MIYPDLHLRYVFSVLLSAHKAQLGATLFVFSSFMFSGAALPLPELRRVLPATHEDAYRIVSRYKADLVQRAEDEQALKVPRAEGE